MNYLVSIIVPCYNQGEFLDETLESIEKQTYSNWECIIVNDGSVDETEKIALKKCKLDSRFRYFYKENGGLSSARNRGLAEAKGDFIQFLDSDDYLDKQKIEISLKHIRKFGEGIALSNFEMFSGKFGNSIFKPYCEIKESLLNYNCVLLKWDRVFSIPIHCGFFHCELLSDFSFPEELRAKEDWVMWLHVFKKNPEVFFIDRPLAFYRKHPLSMTANSSFMEENRDKVVSIIENSLHEEDCAQFAFNELEKKNREIKQLKRTLSNYQQTRIFKYGKRIKNSFFGKSILRILKRN